MEIRRTPPSYPRRGPSCLLVLFVAFGIFVGVFVIQNQQDVREVIFPTPTPEPTRSATEYALLADISQEEGAIEEALGYYAQAIALDGTNPEIYIRYINLLVVAGQPEVALERGEEAIVLAPDNDQVWTAVATAFVANGDRLLDAGDPTAANLQYAQAHQYAETAIEINPENATAYAFSAAGLVSQGNPELYQEAQLRADDATVIDPDNPYARLYSGIIFTNLGFYDAAREQFLLGIEVNRDFAQLHYELGYNFFGDGRLPEAILSFQDAIEVNPDFAAAYDGLAHMYLQLGQDNQAEENALKSIELNPNVARAHGRLGEAYLRLNKFELAVEEFGAAVALYGEPTELNARFFYFLADAYLRQGTENCPQAVPYFEQAAAAAADPLLVEDAQEGLVECRRAGLETGQP